MKNLNFPLYHGTSSLFINKIKESGLGGFNPIEYYKVIELLKELEILADTHLYDSSEWIHVAGNPLSTKPIVSRITSQTERHWQHGEVFLTSSLNTAIGYSNKSKFGSEAFTVTFALLELLKKHNVYIENKIFDLYSNLISLSDKEYFPVIFKIENLPIKFLKCGEKGETIEKLINSREIEINVIKSKCEAEEADDYIKDLVTNFRLLKSIPFSKIEQVYL